MKVLGLIVLTLLTACSKQSSTVKRTIGDDKIKLSVLSKDQAFRPISEVQLKRLPVAEELLETTTLPGEGTKDSEKSLVLGFPVELLNEQFVFGGVITEVSDPKNETLGGLKLTDLPSIHVKLGLARDDRGTLNLTLIGCVSECDENSVQHPLLGFPVLGMNETNKELIVDLSRIGSELNLVQMLDPKGEGTQLKTKSSVTTSFEYSLSTLLFDVRTVMIPLESDDNDPTAPETEFTVRWYLKLSSGFNPVFTSRAATDGVGFFKTDRSASNKITRFSTTGNSKVHYYIKNVPQEYRAPFVASFANWNKTFTEVLGKELLSFEFIETEDPRSKEIVAGDVRYNVIEWDLKNLAGYGGLGPSIANQQTGETYSANILIQGPKIVEMYSKWFGVSAEARDLISRGDKLAAKALLADFNRDLQSKANKTKASYQLTLGRHLKMTVHSDRESLSDPFYKGHFELVPAGMTYETYMDGYLTEMIQHEMGHNLGLRHNFKGNLGAFEAKTKGSVSRSIMEYLGRPFRHLNTIGLYDKMAIAYGYKGVAPTHLNWFCTDEDTAHETARMKEASAECTKEDATSDPYSFWESRLERSIDMLVDRKSTKASAWTLAEISAETTAAIKGLSAYALSAEKTASTWTNFFGKSDRPESASGLKAYVLKSFKDRLCDPTLKHVMANKEDAAAREKTEALFSDLVKHVKALTKGYGLFAEGELECL